MSAAALKVTVLALSGSSMLTLACVIDPMRAANRLASTAAFDWTLCSPDGLPIELSNGMYIGVDGPFGGDAAGEVLVVVAGFEHERHAPAHTVRRLRQASARHRIVCGIEAGTWLLARAGLLRGVTVTTHWEDFETLAERYPSLKLSHERYVTGKRIWSAGGASPTFDMMLNLMRNHLGATLALDVASVFVYDEAHAASDAQPLVSLGRLQTDEPRVSAAVRVMERSLDEPIPVQAIAAQVQLSCRRLEHLFREHLGAGPGTYYRQLRLQQARKLVRDTRLPMQAVALRTGFASQSAFTRAFRKHFGITPTQSRAALRGDKVYESITHAAPAGDSR